MAFKKSFMKPKKKISYAYIILCGPRSTLTQLPHNSFPRHIRSTDLDSLFPSTWLIHLFNNIAASRKLACICANPLVNSRNVLKQQRKTQKIVYGLLWLGLDSGLRLFRAGGGRRNLFWQLPGSWKTERTRCQWDLFIAFPGK